MQKFSRQVRARERLEHAGADLPRRGDASRGGAAGGLPAGPSARRTRALADAALTLADV